MNFEIINLIRSLMNGYGPENRVFRKTMCIYGISILFLFYFRHANLALHSISTFIGSIVLSIIIWFIFFIGSLISGSIYLKFLRDVKADFSCATIFVHFIELIFAALTPFFGLLGYYFAVGRLN